MFLPNIMAPHLTLKQSRINKETFHPARIVLETSLPEKKGQKDQPVVMTTWVSI